MDCICRFIVNTETLYYGQYCSNSLCTVDSIVAPRGAFPAMFLVKNCGCGRCFFCQELLGLAWQPDPNRFQKVLGLATQLYPRILSIVA